MEALPVICWDLVVFHLALRECFSLLSSSRGLRETLSGCPNFHALLRRSVVPAIPWFQPITAGELMSCGAPEHGLVSISNNHDDLGVFDGQQEFSDRVHLIEAIVDHLEQHEEHSSEDDTSLKAAIGTLSPFQINMRNMGSYGGAGSMSAKYGYPFINDVTLLFMAVERGLLGTVRMLLAKGASPNVLTLDADGYGHNSLELSCLHLAVLHADVPVARSLLLGGASVSLRSLVFPGRELTVDSAWYMVREQWAQDARWMTPVELAAALNAGNARSAASLAMQRLLEDWPGNVPPFLAARVPPCDAPMLSRIHGSCDNSVPMTRITLSQAAIAEVNRSQERPLRPLP